MKPRRSLVLLSVASSAFACNSTSGPVTRRPIDVRVAASASGSAGTANTAPIVINSLRLVVGAAALGSGDQFGCVDCQGDDTESSPAPQLISVPADGTPVSVATEEVGIGHYSSAEIELVRPDAGISAADRSWPAGATVKITGTFNGTPFTLHLALEGSFRESLDPPVDVTDSGVPATVSVTITLPVASWFTANGVSLDPNDPGQRAQIEQNARASLDAEGAEGSGERESP